MRIEAVVDVCVIGGGSRGLLVLQRICGCLQAWSEADEFTVAVVEPASLGAGIHQTDQPEYILFNTPSVATSIFPSPSLFPKTPGPRGPTFLDWSGHPPYGYPTRSEVGRYLQWAARRILNQAPPGVTIRQIMAEATNIRRLADGKYGIQMAGMTELVARSVFLTTGHGLGPTPEKRDHRIARDLGDGRTVAVAGMGLAAHDVISALTVGRGGRFAIGKRGDVVYEPSGREPKIFLYSRSGLPYRARPKPGDGYASHSLKFASVSNAANIHDDRGRISIRDTIWPIVLLEMVYQYAWHATEIASEPASGAIRRMYAALREMPATDIDAAIDLAASHTYLFNPRELISDRHIVDARTSHDYRSRFVEMMWYDLAEAELGRESSLKHALDTLVRVRLFLKAAVDMRDIADREWVFGDMTSAINRAAIGPQYERNAEWLVLMRQGILDLSLGPGPRRRDSDGLIRLRSRYPEVAEISVDHLFNAFVPPWSKEDIGSSLVRRVRRSGLIQGQSIVGSGLTRLHLSDGHRCLNGDGAAERIWVLGMPSEGTTYYNNYIPVPEDDADLPHRESHLAVVDCLSSIGISVASDCVG